MSNTYFNAPYAPESNPPIVPQFYRPGVYYITSITRGTTTTITTNVNHQYVVGQQVRLIVPNNYGMFQVNEQTAFVESIPTSTSIVVDIDTTQYNTFNYPPPYLGPIQAQVSAIGNVNTGVPSNQNGRVLNGTTIPGAYITTSPIEGTWLN